MTTEERKTRAITFLLASQILQKRMLQFLYEIAQYNDAALYMLNKDADFIANNIETFDAQFISATRIVKEDK